MISGGNEEIQERYWIDYFRYFWDPCRHFSHKIKFMKDHKPIIVHQRRLNPPMQEVINKEIIKFFDVGVIYFIVENRWVSHSGLPPRRNRRRRPLRGLRLAI